MILSELISLSRNITKSDANTFPDSLAVQYLNLAQDDYTSLVLEASATWDFEDQGYSDYQIARGDIKLNQRDYEFDQSVLKIDRVEIDYDLTGDFKILPIVNESELDTALETTETGTPSYCYIRGGALWLDKLPDKAVVAGLRLYYQRSLSRFATDDQSKEPGIPRNNHKYLAFKAGHYFALANSLRSEASIEKQLMMDEERITHNLNMRSVKPRLQAKFNTRMK